MDSNERFTGEQALIGTLDWSSEDVPVFVDDSVASEAVTLVRCNYLTIERDELDPSWLLGLEGQQIPILLIRLAAILTQPFGGPRFTEPALIEDLHKRLEKSRRLWVDAGELWFPSTLFRTTISAGDVYRVKRGLFIKAFLHRLGLLSQEMFLVDCEERRTDVEFSEKETQAFNAWQSTQLRESTSPKKSEKKRRSTKTRRAVKKPRVRKKPSAQKKPRVEKKSRARRSRRSKR
jgi:hypothetical protein